MKYLNAFQIVLVLVLAPFGIQWLSAAEFRGASAAFYGSIILYGLACIFNIVAIADKLSTWDGK